MNEELGNTGPAAVYRVDREEVVVACPENDEGGLQSGRLAQAGLARRKKCSPYQYTS